MQRKVGLSLIPEGGGDAGENGDLRRPGGSQFALTGEKGAKLRHGEPQGTGGGWLRGSLGGQGFAQGGTGRNGVIGSESGVHGGEIL